MRSRNNISGWFDTESSWTNINPTLKHGHLYYTEDTIGGNVVGLKIGTGVNWLDTPYLIVTSTVAFLLRQIVSDGVSYSSSNMYFEISGSHSNQESVDTSAVVHSTGAAMLAKAGWYTKKIFKNTETPITLTFYMKDLPSGTDHTMWIGAFGSGTEPSALNDGSSPTGIDINQQIAAFLYNSQHGVYTYCCISSNGNGVDYVEFVSSVTPSNNDVLKIVIGDNYVSYYVNSVLAHNSSGVTPSPSGLMTVQSMLFTLSTTSRNFSMSHFSMSQPIL